MGTIRVYRDPSVRRSGVSARPGSLPIPIVDGGLFLFLVYEKIKGHPPSLAFQNAATVLGIFLIGTMIVVVTWYDLARLLG